MLILLLYAVALHSHSAATAEPYVGRLPPGYKPGHQKMNPRPVTRIEKVKSGPRRVQVGGPIKTTFFVPDAAFGEHLAFAKMMENIFFGATSAVDPKALAKSIKSIKSFFRTLNKMSKNYKQVTNIQNFKPRMKQLQRHLKARIKHLVPLDYFELNGYDTTGVGESAETEETSFGGGDDEGAGPSSEKQPDFDMSEEVKSGFKPMLSTDSNLTISERVAELKQKMNDLFASKRGIVEDSVKHYGTRAVYNAIEQAIPRPNASARMPKLSYDAIVKDVRKELHGHFKDFHDKAREKFDFDFFDKTVPLKRLRIPAIRLRNSTRIFRRNLNDIDNILAYEDQKRKDKNVPSPSSV